MALQTIRSTVVSSLHGRVYRISYRERPVFFCFLPTREGVSQALELLEKQCPFPPYTGGCIEDYGAERTGGTVSSLHGRVYRSMNTPVDIYTGFLPTREGVSR